MMAAVANFAIKRGCQRTVPVNALLRSIVLHRGAFLSKRQSSWAWRRYDPQNAVFPKRTGDATIAVFASARAAIDAVVRAQRELKLSLPMGTCTGRVGVDVPRRKRSGPAQEVEDIGGVDGGALIGDEKLAPVGREDQGGNVSSRLERDQ